MCGFERRSVRKAVAAAASHDWVLGLRMPGVVPKQREDEVCRRASLVGER